MRIMDPNPMNDAQRFDHARIQSRLEGALASDGEERAREIAFHMTDWLNELVALVRIYRDPDNATDDEIASALLDFLIHAPSHIGIRCVRHVLDGRRGNAQARWHARRRCEEPTSTSRRSAAR